MYDLYASPDTASTLPHMMLRELGAPFRVIIVDRKGREQAGAAYRRLNPHGRIPVLVEDGRAIHETAAIALHLADKHPGLAPAVGHPDRGDYLKWMVHLANTTQADYRAWFYAHEFVDDPAHAASAKAAAGARLCADFAIIAAELGAGPWLLSSGFSAADLYLLMMTQWGSGLPVPARSLPALADHARRVLARPAVQATYAAEGITELYL